MAVYRPTYTDKKTGKAKQSRVWWYHFNFAGRHVQESSKSTRKTIATEAEKKRRLELQQVYAGIPVADHGRRVRTISAVLKEYESSYAVNHRASSIVMVKNRKAHLDRLLGSMLPSDITAQQVVEYMERRRNEGAGNRTINLDLQILASAMGHTWKFLWPRVKKLQENHDVGRALSAEEEQAIFDAAAKNQSRLIYPFLYTLAWTGMRSDEGRTLRWAQIDMTGTGEITVGGSKTEAGRGRKIPLTANLEAVLAQHAEWCASKLGRVKPDWYVSRTATGLR